MGEDPHGDLPQAKPKYGNRIRGGAVYLVDEGKFVCTIAVWNTPEGVGDPDKEWYTDERFDTEKAAWAHYKAEVRPLLTKIYEKMMSGAPPGTKFEHHESGLE